MVVTIREIETNREWKYIWLKYVNGFDLSHHCAKCLLGMFSSKIHNRIKHEKNIVLNESKARYYYLCGVSEPYIWKENFHLAFKEVRGSVIDFDENGIHVIIENAEQIPFSEADVNWGLEHADKKEYYTCRNWQFANKMDMEQVQKYLDDYY